MKKKVFGAVALIAIAVAAGWNVQQSNNKVEMSDLTLENIEALASGETYPGCNWYVTYGWNGNYGNTYMQKVCTSGGSSCCE